MRDRLSEDQVVKFLEQLVESERNEAKINGELRNFELNESPPFAPPTFANLDALLDYHSARTAHEDAKSDLLARLRWAKADHDLAAERLAEVLPAGHVLSYTYQGQDAELQGMKYGIQNYQGRVRITGSSGPARSRG